MTSPEGLRTFRQMLHARPTDSVASRERLGEIAAILAAGLLRLKSRKSSPNSLAPGDSSLDCEGSIGGDEAVKIEVSRP
jgi:hypothetical protein